LLDTKNPIQANTFVELLGREGVRFVTMEAAVAAYRDSYLNGVSLRS